MRYIISTSLTSALAGTLAAGVGFAAAAPLTIVTDVPVVHALVSQVTGDLAEPVLLLERGASEHHFQLRPSQAAQIAGADLVVQIGPELTPWLAKALSLRGDQAPVLALLHDPGTHRQAYGAGTGGEAHDHEHEHDHDHAQGHDPEAGQAAGEDHADHAGHDDHEGHSHAAGAPDPHAWLDPANGQHWLSLIAAELSRLDPENAAEYQANAEAAAAGIAAKDKEIAALLAPVAEKPFATFHDAYGYFTGHYGLQAVGSIAAGDAATPGARHLSELRAKVERGEILCLFPEAGQDPAPLERVAEATGVKIGGLLDPVGSAMEPGPGLYLSLLDQTATTLAECLSR